jgi:hypothetical protein
MNIKLSYIEKILNNITSIETNKTDLDETGNIVPNGSIEFEITDSTGRLWGGRLCEIDGNMELVEFFPKLFYSDMSFDKLIHESKNYVPNIKSQEFDELSDFID